MATFGNVYALSDAETDTSIIVFYRVLVEGCSEVVGNKGEPSTIEQMKQHLREQYTDIEFLSTMPFSIEVCRRNGLL